MNDLSSLHQKFRRETRPYMEMLLHKKSELNHPEWITLVRQTEQNILNSPDQYLSDLPQKDVLNSLINVLFNEFIEHQG